MDETLRSLQRLAASGSDEAQKRYIRALERATGIEQHEPEVVYQAQNKGWFPKSNPRQTDPRFSGENSQAVIYGEGMEAMLSIHFQDLGNLGFALNGFPKDYWDWLMGSLTSQVGELVNKSYRLGRIETQHQIRKALGLPDDL